MIRPFTDSDWPSVWRSLEPIFRAGDTYAFPADITESGARKAWVETAEAVFVAADQNGLIVGTYYLRPNEQATEPHVCNCGYAVDADARGRGVASDMCLHSLAEAVARGYGAMQFNRVASTNDAAVHLWKKHGFSVVRRLPNAFQHPTLGPVEALVMRKQLKP